VNETLLGALHDWQELAGAFLGGLFALLVAWYVATDARRREERAAAMIVITALVRLAGNYRAAKQQFEKGQDDPDRVVVDMAAMFALHSPTLSALASEAIHRLLMVHPHLSAHLSLLEMINSEVEASLVRWRQDIEDFVRSGEKEFKRSPGSRFGDAKTIARGTSTMVNHAACAVFLLNRLVLSRFPTFHRLLLAVFPGKIKKLCREGLAVGNFKDPVPWE
jgi:hypothetical protein